MSESRIRTERPGSPGQTYILLTTSDADLHLEPLLHGGSALEVLGSGVNVVLDFLLRQVDHVRGEQRGAVLLEEALVLVEHAVEPWQELLGAVVGVQDDGDAVDGGNGTDVVGGGNGTGHGSLLLVGAVGNALSGEVGSTSLGGLEDDGRLGIPGSFEGSDTVEERNFVSQGIRLMAVRRYRIRPLTQWRKR